jgi:uncharacterized protein with PIN domain
MHLRQEKEIRFFVDAMLGNIAKKLRVLGYDSKYFSDIDDEQLINEARKENRIIISKDGKLVKKAQKLEMKPVFITKNDEIDQFLEITSQTKLSISQINGDSARCVKCNSITELVEKTTVKEKVPVKVYETNDYFWKCKNCSKVYWEGTHIKNLQKFVSEVNERLQ